jgi:type IV pilus assembly protein PilX
MSGHFHSLHTRHHVSAQRGVVLLMALIFLLLLTMLAISAAGRSLLQERMVGGLRNAQLAEMGAEAAVRGAEWKLWSLPARGLRLDCPSDLLGSCYSFDSAMPNSAANRLRTSASWPTNTDLGASTEYKGDGGNAIDYATLLGSTLTGESQKIARLTKNPRYIIERLGQETPPGAGSQIEGGVTAVYGSSSTPSTSLWIWRVTARSTGANADTMRIVESTYAAPGSN